MTLRDALQAVYDRHGMLTPTLVVEVARDGNDAVAERLHEALPWDADEALERLQIIVARNLIRKVRIVYRPTPKSGLREVRQFASVPAAESRGRAYHPNDVWAVDPIMRELVLAEAKRAWSDFKKRYGHLREVVEMVRHDLDEELREAA